jgi:hypothetical protein
LNLTDYIVDPINLKYFTDWLQRNQQLHIEMDAAVNSQPIDLSQLDPTNKNQLQAWIYSHFLEHQTAENILKIGT